MAGTVSAARLPAGIMRPPTGSSSFLISLPGSRSPNGSLTRGWHISPLRGLYQLITFRTTERDTVLPACISGWSLDYACFAIIL